MEEASNYIFVYGTLLDPANEFAVYLAQNSRFYGEGKFKSRLYDTGAYPAAIFLPSSAGYVHGKVFLLHNPKEVFEKLDEYEGFGENQPQPNEFIRKILTIEMNETMLNCWIYLYNLSVRDLKQINSEGYFDI